MIFTELGPTLIQSSIRNVHMYVKCSRIIVPLPCNVRLWPSSVAQCPWELWIQTPWDFILFKLFSPGSTRFDLFSTVNVFFLHWYHWHYPHASRDFVSAVCGTLNKLCLKIVVTESVPRPIQSISCAVRMYVCMYVCMYVVPPSQAQIRPSQNLDSSCIDWWTPPPSLSPPWEGLDLIMLITKSSAFICKRKRKKEENAPLGA